MNRLEFIKTCGALCLGGTALLTLAQSCASADYYAKNEMVEGKIRVPKGEFTRIDSEGQSHTRPYILLRHQALSSPIVLFPIENDAYRAILMKCTHRGCELSVQETLLACPCHGSEFSREGRVLSPPADRDLQTYTVTTDDAYIYISQ